MNDERRQDEMLWKENDKPEPLLCPRCGGKTRLKLRKDTELKN